MNMYLCLRFAIGEINPKKFQMFFAISPPAIAKDNFFFIYYRCFANEARTNMQYFQMVSIGIRVLVFFFVSRQSPTLHRNAKNSEFVQFATFMWYVEYAL